MTEWPDFDNRFIWFYRQQVKEIRRRLLTGGGFAAGGGGVDADEGASKYLEVIAEQEKEINFLKVRIEVSSCCAMLSLVHTCPPC